MMINRKLKVVVASLNPVKVGAVKEAFRTQFTSIELEISPLSVESGVSNQPLSDAETLKGGT